MVDSQQLVKLASFATTFEAERAAATLESAGIPTIIKSHAGGGVFGIGPSPGGVVLYVRQGDMDRAWTLMVSKAL
ncbi:MAG TPA: DUF2007 domain-containing protein [Gemmatimonadaceae bacterium]|jgi:hypothetical protein